MAGYFVQDFLITLLSLNSPLLQARNYIDGHVHYVDFFREPEGMQALLSAMDQSNISHTAIMSIPRCPKTARR